MKYEILGVSKSEYNKKIMARVIICIAVALVAVILNILLTVFRTDSTHTAFLVINIVADTVAFCFIYFFVSTQILFRKKLYKLSGKTSGLVVGEIKEISNNTQTVNGLECYEVTVEAEGTRKVFLAKEGAVPSDLNGKVKLVLSDNIVVSAEVQS